jgi:uncharacterized protein (DUF697 family)
MSEKTTDASKEKKVIAIIAGATALAIAGAAVPIPIADAAMITFVQASMLLSISAIYGRVINRNTVPGLILAVGAMHVGTTFASFVKGIPGIGTIAGTAAQAVIAGTITYALGLAFNSLCIRGLDFSRENLKESLKDKTIWKKAMKEAMKIIQLKKAVNFHVEPPKAVDHVRFHMNLRGRGAAQLKVVYEDNSEISSQEVAEDTSELRFDVSNLKVGKYLATLQFGEKEFAAVHFRKMA